MARTDKLLMLLAIVIVVGAASAIGLVYGSQDTEDFTETPVNLDPGNNDNGSGVSRARGPSRRDSNADANSEDNKNEVVEIIQAEEGTIVGTVLDHEDKPFEGVEVISTLYFPYGELNYGLISSHIGKAKTNKEGRFSIDVPGHGCYRVRFKHRAFAPHLESDVRAGADLEVKLKIGGALEGVITAQETNKPIKGAKITVRQNKGSWSESSVSDDEGKFFIYGIHTGELYVSATVDDYLPLVDQVVDVAQGKMTKLELALSAGRTIKGVVTDKNGAWVAKPTIKVGNRTIQGDDFGRFHLGGLTKSSHNIQVHADNFLTHSQRVSLQGSREVADLKIELDRGGKLHVTVLDDKGEALKDVEVKVFESWGSDYMWDTGNTRYKAVTDENGRATLSGMRQQNWSQWRIRATLKGWADTFSDQFRLDQKAKEKDFTLVMRKGGAITGHIYNEGGSGIKGVKVSLSPSNVYEWSGTGNKNSKSVLTDEKGAYEFTELSARSYRISAMARNFATQYKNNIKVVGSATIAGTDLTLKEGGVVAGTVKTNKDEPIPNAEVTIRSQSSWGRGKTDAEGKYKISNLGEGPYTATARCNGYSFDQKKKVFPVEGKIDFELRPDGFAWGQVIDKVTEKPVKNYRVELQKKQTRGNNWRTHKSLYVNDLKGKFKIYAPDGTYRLVITSRGHTKYEKDGVAISVTAEPDEMKVKLTPGGSMEGWVKDSLGNGVPWATVYIRKAGAAKGTKFAQKGQTESDGYYYIDSLEAGNYEVAFVRSGTLPLTIRTPVGVFGGEVTNVNVNGRKPSQLILNGRTEDGKRLNWTQVKIFATSDTPIDMRRNGWSRDGANYTPRYDRSTYLRNGQTQYVNGLPPGSYRIEARYSNYELFEDDFVIKDGASMELEIVFRKKNRDNTR